MEGWEGGVERAEEDEVRGERLAADVVAAEGGKEEE